MHHEYAVEPRAIGASWVTFRYLIEQFGFDKGRLISEYPKRWLREVYDTTLGLPPIERKRIEEALNQAKRTKVVKFGRPNYDDRTGDWLANALLEHRRSAFHAIVARENPGADAAVVRVDELNEQHPLMKVSHDRSVPRDAASLSVAMRELLRFGSRVMFVDPFYDPYSDRYKKTFRECLATIKAQNPRAVCEIHYRYHSNKPTNVDLEREAQRLFRGIVPAGMAVVLFCWQEKVNGEDFHDRFLLTDRGGISIGAGFSADGGHQTTIMSLMSFGLCQEKINAFARASTHFDLVGPVIRVTGDGMVARI